MRALVTAASRHGSTDEIAEALAGALRDNGAEVDLIEPAAVHEITDYDTIVLGSAIYLGHWMKDAKSFAERFADALRLRQVWLFSSGPVGDNDPPVGDPAGIPDLLKMTGAVEHRLFSGKLDRSELGFGERVAVRAVHAPEGDYRDWNAVRDWAEVILGTPRYTRHLEPEGTP